MSARTVKWHLAARTCE